MTIRIAACQILTYPSPKESTEKILDYMDKAASKGVGVAAFPEAALCGYQYDEQYWENVDPGEFIKEEQRIIATSEKLGIGIVVGTPRWEDGILYNSLLIVDKGIVLGYYDKTHPIS